MEESTMDTLVSSPAASPPSRPQTEPPQRHLRPRKLPEGAWNKSGVKPSPDCFTNDPQASDFWLAALCHPQLAAYEQPVWLAIRDLRRDAHGDFRAEIEIHERGTEKHLELRVPAQAALGQLKNDANGRKPVHPFPLEVMGRDGAALGMMAAGSRVGELATFLGLPVEELNRVHIHSVVLSIYDDVELGITATYRGARTVERTLRLPLSDFLARAPALIEPITSALATVSPTPS
jgi:hypothetical protein